VSAFDLVRWSEAIRTGPEPLAYIVLDHAVPLGTIIQARDFKGWWYVRISPAICDELRHQTVSMGPLTINLLRDASIAPSIIGVPVYKRESLPATWPDAPAA
jgi:hypothetical protein